MCVCSCKICSLSGVPLPCDFILQFGNVCHIVLNIKEQRDIPGTTLMVLLKLFTKWLFPINPAQVAILTGKLQTKVVNLQ